MDQGSAGDCGLFRYRQFERVSEIPGIPATHTVPTLFPDQFVPGCELIPGHTLRNESLEFHATNNMARDQARFRALDLYFSSSSAVLLSCFGQ